MLGALGREGRNGTKGSVLRPLCVAVGAFTAFAEVVSSGLFLYSCQQHTVHDGRFFIAVLAVGREWGNGSLQ